MATKETVYEAIVALRAESTQLRTDLTSAHSQLEKSLTSMGSMAQRLAPILTIGGIAAFGKSVLDTASEVTDLAAQTGFAAQTLSGIKSTLEENGTSLDAFARSVFIAQKNLGGIDEESDKAAVAIARLGLNVDDLKNASPEEFLKKVGGAMAGIANPTDRAAIGATIFGKAWKEIGPILGEVAANLDKLRASGMSEADIKKLDDFGDAITKLGNTSKILAAGPLAGLADTLMHLFGGATDSLTTAYLASKKLKDELASMDAAAARRAGLRAKGLGFFAGGDEDEAALKRRSQLRIAIAEAEEKKLALIRAPKKAPVDTTAQDALSKKAKDDLQKLTDDLGKIGLSPLATKLAEINLGWVKWKEVAAAALKGEALAAFNKRIDEAKANLESLAKIEIGKGAVSGLESKTGIELPITVKLNTEKTFTEFAAVFSKMKDGSPETQAALGKMWNGMISKAIEQGAPDLRELAKSIGLTITFSDITEEEFQVLELIEAERQGHIKTVDRGDQRFR